MRYFIILLFILPFSNNTIAQTSDWSFLMPPNGDVNLFTINGCKHKHGYTYVGAYSSLLELSQQTITNLYGWGLFLAKYDTNGLPISLQKLGSANLTAFGNSNFRIGIAVDSMDNSYIGINFKDSIEIFNQKLYGGSYFNALLFKINPLGNLVWNKKVAGKAGAVVGYNDCLKTNNNQTISLAITVSDSTQFDSFWIDKQRGLFANLDTNGQVNWIRKAGKDNIVGGYIAVELNEKKDAYLLGVFESVNNIQYENITVMGGDEYDSPMFYSISKYDSIGQIQWVRHFGGSTYGASFSANTIKTDSKGNLYISGSCRVNNFFIDRYKIQGGGLFEGLSQDAFIIKYDKDGNFKWFKKSTSLNEEYFAGFDISEKDELYLSFTYTISGGFDSIKLNTIGGQDIGLAKFDTLGNLQWITSIGGTSFDENVSLICSDTTIYLLGQSTSTPCHFNQADHITQAPGNLFLARLNKYELWPVGVQESELNGVSIYPNPSQGHLTLSIPYATQGYYSIHDMAGRVLLEQNLNPSQTKYTISTTSLSPGVYLLQVHTAKGSRCEKLVVE